MSDVPEFSIVIPARDEGDNLRDVVSELAAILPHKTFEVVVVDDGSTDATPDILRRLSSQHSFVRHCSHGQSCGKSAAILTGVRAARAEFIATMDGDGQSDPVYLAPLLALAAEPNVGLAAGHRLDLAHPRMKQLASRLANGLRLFLLEDQTRDSACALKAFRKDVFLRLPYFDNMHRFLPALVLREGLELRHLVVVDRPRRHGRSRYGLDPSRHSRAGGFSACVVADATEQARTTRVSDALSELLLRSFLR